MSDLEFLLFQQLIQGNKSVVEKCTEDVVYRYFSVIYTIYKVKDGPVMSNGKVTEEYG